MRKRDHLWQILRPHGRLFAGLVAASLLLTATEGAGMGLVVLLLGSGSKAGAIAGRRWLAPLGHFLQHLSVTDHIRIAAIALFTLTLLRCAIQYAQHLQTLRLRRSVERDLQTRAFRRLHELALTVIQREHLGSLLVMLNQYPQRIGDLALRIGRSVASAVLVLAYVALALSVSWQLTLVTLALLAAVAMGVRPWVGARLRAISQRNRMLMNDVNNVSGEHLPAMKLIRVFDRGAWSEALYQEKLEAAYAYEYRAGALAGISTPLFNLLNALALAAVLLASAALLRGSPQSIAAQLAIFLVIAFRLMGPVGSLAELQTQVVEAGPIMDALFDFLEPMAPDAAAPRSGSRSFEGLRQGVSFDNVTFRYAPGDAPALHGLTLTIPKGRMTAVVGASGSGKSTLVALVARLYDPEIGCVRADGIDLRELNLGQWRRRVVLAGQDLPLFHASVRDNLLFAKPNATGAEIDEACRMAQAHEFIQSLPEGYDTILQDRGMRLSAGQRQRIVLARALLAESDFLMLDEATSELDVLTEAAIHEALARCGRGRTALVVAHRLSTVRHADRILVLEKGRVAEEGTHESLVAARGLYRRMIGAQDREDAADFGSRIT